MTKQKYKRNAGKKKLNVVLNTAIISMYYVKNVIGSWFS